MRLRNKDDRGIKKVSGVAKEWRNLKMLAEKYNGTVCEENYHDVKLPELDMIALNFCIEMEKYRIICVPMLSLIGCEKSVPIEVWLKVIRRIKKCYKLRT